MLIELKLSPAVVNARIYGTDYVVVVSPGQWKSSPWPTCATLTSTTSLIH